MSQFDVGGHSSASKYKVGPALTPAQLVIYYSYALHCQHISCLNTFALVIFTVDCVADDGPVAAAVDPSRWIVFFASNEVR